MELDVASLGDELRRLDAVAPHMDLPHAPLRRLADLVRAEAARP